MSKTLKVLLGLLALTSLLALGCSLAALSDGPGLRGEKGDRGERGLGGVTNVDEIAAGDAASKWELLSLDAGEDQASYRNTSGHSEIVDYSNFTTDGTASSSFRVIAVATTSSSFADAHDFLAPVYADLAGSKMFDVTIATSTTATTTNSIMRTAMNDGSSDGSILLKNLEYLILYLQRGDTSCPTSGTDTGGCEAATSTNRGFSNLDALFSIHATSTSNR